MTELLLMIYLILNAGFFYYLGSEQAKIKNRLSSHNHGMEIYTEALSELKGLLDTTIDNVIEIQDELNRS